MEARQEKLSLDDEQSRVLTVEAWCRLWCCGKDERAVCWTKVLESLGVTCVSSILSMSSVALSAVEKNHPSLLLALNRFRNASKVLNSAQTKQCRLQQLVQDMRAKAVPLGQWTVFRKAKNASDAHVEVIDVGNIRYISGVGYILGNAERCLNCVLGTDPNPTCVWAEESCFYRVLVRQFSGLWTASLATMCVQVHERVSESEFVVVTCPVEFDSDLSPPLSVPGGKNARKVLFEGWKFKQLDERLCRIELMLHVDESLKLEVLLQIEKVFQAFHWQEEVDVKTSACGVFFDNGIAVPISNSEMLETAGFKDFRNGFSSNIFEQAATNENWFTVAKERGLIGPRAKSSSGLLVVTKALIAGGLEMGLYLGDENKVAEKKNEPEKGLTVHMCPKCIKK